MSTELRKQISEEIEQARKPYLDLANDRTSVEYAFYQGVCNGMNYAKVIVENPNDSN